MNEIALDIAKNLLTLVAYPVLAAALYYLGYHAKITEPIWSRYGTGAFDKFMRCPACSGTWYAFLVALVLGASEGLPFFFMDGDRVLAWALSGLWGMFWVPVASAAMLQAFGAVVGPFEQAEAPPSTPPDVPRGTSPPPVS